MGGVTLSSGEGAGEGMGSCASWEKIDGWTRCVQGLLGGCVQLKGTKLALRPGWNPGKF